MRARISSPIRDIFQGVLAGAGWNEGEEGEGKDLRRVAWALQRSLDLRDQGQRQSLLSTRPPAKWVPFVPASESHMGAE